MATPEAVPDHDALRAILTAPDAPPVITLDLGGSADVDGDGFVRVSLDERGDLVFEDA